MTVSSRSIRLPLILGAFNMVLAIFAVFMMAVIVDSAKIDAQIDYGTFLEIFRYVATIEFVMILVIMPALTAGEISGERERKTLVKSNKSMYNKHDNQNKGVLKMNIEKTIKKKMFTTNRRSN